MTTITKAAQLYLIQAYGCSFSDELSVSHGLFVDDPALQMFADDKLDLDEAKAMTGLGNISRHQTRLLFENQADAALRIAGRFKDPAEARAAKLVALRLYLCVAHDQGKATLPAIAKLARELADPAEVKVIVAQGVSIEAAELFAAMLPGADSPTDDATARAVVLVHAADNAEQMPDPKVSLALSTVFPPGKGARAALQRTLSEVQRRATATEPADKLIDSVCRELEALPMSLRMTYAKFVGAGGTAVEVKAIDPIAKKHKAATQLIDTSDGVYYACLLAERLHSVDPTAIGTPRFEKAVQFLCEYHDWSVVDMVQSVADLDDLAYPDVGFLLARRFPAKEGWTTQASLEGAQRYELKLNKPGDRIRKMFVSACSETQLVDMLAQVDRPWGSNANKPLPQWWYQAALDELKKRKADGPTAFTAFRAAGGKLDVVVRNLIAIDAVDAFFSARDVLLQPLLQASPYLTQGALPFLVKVMTEGTDIERSEIESWLVNETARGRCTLVLKSLAEANLLTHNTLLERVSR